jgi:hypothetical protein
MILFAGAKALCSIIEAVKLYFFCRNRDHTGLGSFNGFDLMVAVKNGCQDVVMQLLENPTPNIGSPGSSFIGDVLAVASTLASHSSRLEPYHPA